MRLFAGTPFDRPPKCERCGALEAECQCVPPAATWIAPALQTVQLKIEKRRKGKVVTVIRGLSANANDLPSLLSQLKSQCGAGGTIHDDGVEIQGEHVERLAALLSELGYVVKS
jgi:translation initiation factor 1